MKQRTPMRAYHFTNKALRDGRRVPKPGKWLVHKGTLEMCVSGLHASLHPFDALQYAPGAMLHLVELDGEIIKGDDKVVARKRMIVASFDAEDLLGEFARKCALDVYDKWGNEKTDPKGIVKRYLKTGDESLRDAAWAAAWDAARAAAMDAAMDAAWDAAWAAAWAAQRRRFKPMVDKRFNEILKGEQ
jgi:hypothetical protein